MAPKTKPKRFAEGTNVPTETSRADIERMLTRHGANSFISAWDDDNAEAMLMFRMQGRMLRFKICYPTEQDVPNTRLPRTNGKARRTALEKRFESEYRRRWRALHLIIKAKLEIVAGGDSTFEKEFLGDILLPDKSTVAEHLLPQVAAAYDAGVMPKLLG